MQSSTPFSVPAGGVSLDSLTTGSVTVNASGAGATLSQLVTITTPGITVSSRTVGAGLQAPGTVSLDLANHGGVVLRIESSNPAVALVAPDAASAGASFILLNLPNGTPNTSFYIQGVEGAGGTVVLTASAAGFTNGTATGTIVPPAIRLESLPGTISQGAANVNFQASIGIPNNVASDLLELQPLRFGGSPLTVTFNNSNAAAGQLTTTAGSAQSRTAVISPGANFTPSGLGAGGVQFDPLAPGSTVISATASGFASTGAAAKTVTVTQ